MQVRNEASLHNFEAEVAQQGGLTLETLECDCPVVAFEHLLCTEPLDHVRMYRLQVDETG